MARTKLRDLPKEPEGDVEAFGFTYTSTYTKPLLSTSTNIVTSPTISSTTLSTSTYFGKLNLGGVLAG